MTAPFKWDINADETFEHLPHAPIVEAVIDIRARASQDLEESLVKKYLETRLDGYAFLDSQREFHQEIKLEDGRPPLQEIQDLGWSGVRFRSLDQKHIVRFGREGVSFSRLQSYVNWAQLSHEGLKFWVTYRDLGQPLEIQRMGLRFINRIQLPPGDVRLEDYLVGAPQAPQGLDLPFLGFLHRDTLAFPGHPYAINVIRTIQPPAGVGEGGGLILDIDVFTTQGMDLAEAVLSGHLQAMRWLKNKVFFGSITEKTLEGLR